MPDSSPPTIVLSRDALIVTHVAPAAGFPGSPKKLEKLLSDALRKDLTVISSDSNEENLKRAIGALHDAFRTVAALRRSSIDANLAGMANDSDYHATVLEIAREFARSDWEAFQHGEKKARQGGGSRL